MIAYYNDNDRYICDWLQNLMDAGEIMPGKIDDRSVDDVDPESLFRFTRCHFFAGIAGWDLALRFSGWPIERPVWTGSCPCQPLSSAGKRKGAADERHLWPAFHRLIEICRPPTIFGEQVASNIGREWLSAVRLDLEQLGYAVGGADLPAASVGNAKILTASGKESIISDAIGGAPHIRQRLWWVAHSDHYGRRSRSGQENSRSIPDRTHNDGKLGDSEIGGIRPCDGKSRQSAEAPESAGRSSVSGGSPLAYSDGRDSEDERIQRSGQHGFEPENGRTGVMADPEIPEARTAIDLRERQPESCDGRELGDSHRSRPQRQIEYVGKHADQLAPWASSLLIHCSDGKLRPVPVEPRFFPLAPRVSADLGSDRPGEASPFRVITDPETGRSIGQKPWRIGMLRAYGNSIVPQTGALFILSFLDL